MLPYAPNDMLRAMRATQGWGRAHDLTNDSPGDEAVEAMLRRRGTSSRPGKTRLAILGSILVLALVALATGASIVT